MTAKTLGWTEYEKLAVQKAQEDGNFVYHVQAQIDPHCAMPIAGRQLVQNALAGMGEVLAARPEAGSPAATKQVEFLVATDEDRRGNFGEVPDSHHRGQRKDRTCCRAKLRSRRSVRQDSRRKLPKPRIAAAPELPTLHEPEPQPAKRTKVRRDTRRRPHTTLAENILRVDAERIDSVLNLVGELIIGKSMLQQALNEFSQALSQGCAARKDSPTPWPSRRAC